MEHLERELAAVTAELDALKQSILDLSHPNCQMLLQDKAACQQEVWRLREALEKIAKSETCADEAHGCNHPFDAQDALSSTPTPVHTDTERLDWIEAEGRKHGCKCTLRGALVGDGCEVCNPQLAKDIADENARDLSDLLQDCFALFNEIALQDDAGHFQINHRIRTQLDALCKQIKAEI